MCLFARFTAYDFCANCNEPSFLLHFLGLRYIIEYRALLRLVKLAEFKQLKFEQLAGRVLDCHLLESKYSFRFLRLKAARTSLKSVKLLAIDTFTAAPKSHVSLRTPREYFCYSKHIMAK